MKPLKGIIFLFSGVILIACAEPKNTEALKGEITESEKAFEKMAAEKGIAEAFYFFADDNAVIKRENDTLIVGKDNIKAYYEPRDDKNTTVNWAPDFVEVSKDGTLAYTYGKYIWKVKNDTGAIVEYKGVFHTVWKRQKDNSWKYVWD
jgi:ketosteroid isomerase-like protein